MVQPAKRFDLWRRLYSRFLIEPFPAQEGDSPGVATTIFPVTQADDLLLAHGQKEVDTASFNSDGAKNGLVVPEGKRWKVQGMQAVRKSGDRDIDQFVLSDASEGLTLTLVIFTATNNSSLILGTEITLEEFDRIDIQATGGAAATVFTVKAWVSEEDAF